MSKRRIDKSAVFKDAHKRFRDGQRLNLGWTFGQCLSTAWAAAKLRREWEAARPAPAIATRRASSLARAA